MTGERHIPTSTKHANKYFFSFNILQLKHNHTFALDKWVQVSEPRCVNVSPPHTLICVYKWWSIIRPRIIIFLHWVVGAGWCISFLTVAIVSIPVSTFDSWYRYSSPSMVANTFITWLIFPWRRIGIVFVPKMIQNGELIHKSVFGPSSNDINTALYHFSLLSDIL